MKCVGRSYVPLIDTCEPAVVSPPEPSSVSIRGHTKYFKEHLSLSRLRSRLFTGSPRHDDCQLTSLLTYWTGVAGASNSDHNAAERTDGLGASEGVHHQGTAEDNAVRIAAGLRLVRAVCTKVESNKGGFFPRCVSHNASMYTSCGGTSNS